MKITIEIDGSNVQTYQSAAQQISSGTGGSDTSAAQAPAAAASGSLSDIFQRAAAVGALNAGPAPSSSQVPSGAGPVITSVGGAESDAVSSASSAGAPPDHVFGGSGGHA